MENSSPLVFDISSDEEAGFGGGYGGGGQFGDGDDCEWLSKLLVQVGGDGGEFCDDVVLVSGDFPNPPKKPRLEPVKPPDEVAGEESDGDDCVVLEGDPYKAVAVTVAVTAKGKVDVGGDDDVEIIAEKGEVACRDFPHARHLCAKFLFASTPPQVHCTQCHCYVCDSLAPCPHWGTGISSVDHCHATDKDEYWKTERKRMKIGNKPLSPVSTSYITSPPPSGLFSQQTQVTSLPQPVFHPVTSQPVFHPVTARPVFHPVTSQPFCQDEPRLPGCAIRPVAVHRPTSQLFPLQSRFRGNVPRRSGLVRVSKPNNHHLNGSRASVSLLGRHTLQQTTGTCSVQQNNSPKVLNLSHRSYIPSQQRQVYHTRPYSFQTPLPPHSTNIMTTTPLPTHEPSHPHLFRPISYAPSQTVSSYLLSAGSNLENANQPSQSQSQSYPSSLFDNLPSNFPQVNHGQTSAIDSIPDDFGVLAWDPQPTQGVEKTENLLTENPQQNSVVVADNHLSVTNDPGSQFPESIPFLFEDWMFGDLPVPGVVEVPVSPLWNNNASVDTGDLFNF